MTVSTATFTLVDGVRIVVPDSLDLITPYVLCEQEDWFEDEIRFLRRLLQPGQKVIDIGANFGVYALCMAKCVQPTGHVWAFEPTSSTALLLAEGIAANGFTQVTLVQSALSSVSGTAQLSLNPNPELNSLVHGATATSSTETVALVSLDECLDRYGWQDIEWVKIDAEGEEANILKGGERFFTQLSPLVQYEIKAGADLHLELVTAFAALGYDSYRLVPGLDLLVSFDPAAPVDGFLLNLFCCKPDRAAQLAARGFLLDSAAMDAAAGSFHSLLANAGADKVYGWQNFLVKLPYGSELEQEWTATMNAGGREAVTEALFSYAIARDPALPAAVRWLALQGCFRHFTALCEQQATHPRLASLARVARDYGARSIAVNALAQLSAAILRQQQVDTSEPFLAPAERFDTLLPGEAIGNWVLAAVFEELERLGSFSSFYTGDEAALQRLQIIAELGYGSPEMQRRLGLVQARRGRVGC
ncbi:MAG: FkbM family methyltransferase [Candidatus Accumulibacter sp. UW20]|jgi:protein O-GlcNAc transferase